MVGLSAQVLGPVSASPELEAQRLFPRVAKGSVSVRLSLKVKLPQFFEIGAHDLISVDVDDSFDVKREQHIEKKNLVAPNDALFL